MRTMTASQILATPRETFATLPKHERLNAARTLIREMTRMWNNLGKSSANESQYRKAA